MSTHKTVLASQFQTQHLRKRKRSQNAVVDSRSRGQSKRMRRTQRGPGSILHNAMPPSPPLESPTTSSLIPAPTPTSTIVFAPSFPSSRHLARRPRYPEVGNRPWAAAKSAHGQGWTVHGNVGPGEDNVPEETHPEQSRLRFTTGSHAHGGGGERRKRHERQHKRHGPRTEDRCRKQSNTKHKGEKPRCAGKRQFALKNETEDESGIPVPSPVVIGSSFVGSRSKKGVTM